MSVAAIDIAERFLISLDNLEELSPAWRAELEDRVLRREKGATHSYSREEVHAEIENILA